MPGFELIGKKEKQAVERVFREGGVLFAHGFESIRKRFHVREFEKSCGQWVSTPDSRIAISDDFGPKAPLRPP